MHIHSTPTGSRTLFVPFIVLILFSSLVAVACQPATDDRTVETDALLIENVHLVDAVHGLRESQDLLVTGDRIEAIGAAGSLETPEGVTSIDGQGRYLIPGLWDAHFHVTNTPEMRDSFYPLFLINGITYARDTAMEMDEVEPIREWTRKVHDEHGWAPDLYLIGPHVDGERLSWTSSVSATTPEEARAHIDRLDALGVDEMKVYELIQPEVFHTVLEEATSRGYRVTSHIPLTMDVIEATDAGLTAMEHLQNVEFSCAENWEELREERRSLIEERSGMEGNELREFLHAHQRERALDRQDEQRCREVIDQLARHEVWQVPT
ncbi:MAG: amidohydrolase family protein, partial [Bacteroidota bacterium]